ncbi:hypothetical protein [Tenacibaculum jejuense]|uniref:CdiI immunity protein domain-containing protein n=1 Tax=Tenacibaculum jejuense TaxID=584609 RepID=A0A238UCV7_9FLAO|nr:hypothetical protein [Tenacibaculum jejuense]SNR16220.1 Protein of unknown function [Tenacibaculum jejuense]
MNDLQSTHPLLFDFFAGYFPDADLDGLTDIQVTEQFITINSNELVQQTFESLTRIDDNAQVLENIVIEANRYFENTNEIQKWVLSLIEVFKKKLS